MPECIAAQRVCTVHIVIWGRKRTRDKQRAKTFFDRYLGPLEPQTQLKYANNDDLDLVYTHKQKVASSPRANQGTVIKLGRYWSRDHSSIRIKSHSNGDATLVHHFNHLYVIMISGEHEHQQTNLSHNDRISSHHLIIFSRYGKFSSVSLNWILDRV